MLVCSFDSIFAKKIRQYLWNFNILQSIFRFYAYKCLGSNLQGKPPDWQDFVGIITLLLINSTISFIEENNAGNAAAALMARLAPKAKVVKCYLI